MRTKSVVRIIVLDVLSPGKALEELEGVLEEGFTLFSAVAVQGTSSCIAYTLTKEVYVREN